MTKVFDNLSHFVICAIGAAIFCSPQVSECAIDANQIDSLQITPDGGVAPVFAGEADAVIPQTESEFAFESEIALGVVEELIGPIDQIDIAESGLPDGDQPLDNVITQLFSFFVLDDGFIVENGEGLGIAALTGESLESVSRFFPLGDDNRDKAMEALLDGIPSGGIGDLDLQALLEVALLLGQNFGDKQLEGEPSLRKAAIDRLKREVVEEFNKRQRPKFARRLQDLIGPPSDQAALARAVRVQELLNRRPEISTGIFGLGNNANQNGVGGLAPEADNFDVLKNDSYVNAATIPQTPAGGGQTFFGPFILNPGVNGASINVNEVIYNFYFNGNNIVTVP